MQIQINNPDTGELKSLTELGEYSPQGYIDHAISVSGEDAGYNVIIGTDLDESPNREVAHVVAVKGSLIWQNVLDPE